MFQLLAMNDGNIKVTTKSQVACHPSLI